MTTTTTYCGHFSHHQSKCGNNAWNVKVGPNDGCRFLNLLHDVRSNEEPPTDAKLIGVRVSVRNDTTRSTYNNSSKEWQQ